MAIEYIYPPFEVIRRDERCTRCRICEKQCANGVHTYDAERKIMLADESKCVTCQRCVALCPTRAITLRGGRPVWEDDCTHCMACIAHCPAEAIEYGRKSLGKPRYRCPVKP